MPESLSPLDYLDLLDQVGAEFRAQSEAIAAAVAAAAATVETKYFTLTVTTTQVESLRFSSAAARVAPTQLRDLVLRAYADACAEAAQKLSSAAARADSPAVAQGVLAARRPATAEAAEQLELDDTAPGAGGDGGGDGPTARERLAAQADAPLLPLTPDEIDQLAARAPEDPAADLAADPDWRRHHRPQPAGGWDADWAQELSDHVATVQSQLAGVADLRGTASSPTLTVVVGTDGSLLDVVFRTRAEPAALTDQFATLYAEAVTSVATRVTDAFDELEDGDADEDDDPAEAFFADLLQRFEPPEPDETQHAPRRW